MEYLSRAKEQKLIRAHGTSCHGMDPLRTAAKNPFVEVDLARINPEGLIMDDKKPDEVASRAPGDARRGQGRHRHEDPRRGGVQGARAPRRLAPLRARPGTVDAFIIGFESTEQVDDILKRTGDALAFVAQRRG